MIAYFKRQRLTKDLLARIVQCFVPVQDEIGNVPPATHNDPQILATLYALVYAALDADALASEKNQKAVTDIIFEEIFRREATAILNRCDQWMHETDSEFHRLFKARLEQPQDALLRELATYVDGNYEKQEYRDL